MKLKMFNSSSSLFPFSNARIESSLTLHKLLNNSLRRYLRRQKKKKRIPPRNWKKRVREKEEQDWLLSRGDQIFEEQKPVLGWKIVIVHR